MMIGTADLIAGLTEMIMEIAGGAGGVAVAGECIVAKSAAFVARRLT